MSWLNLNDSLNSLKGQISNFANNVLAEDHNKDADSPNADIEELKRICHGQQEEIKKLQQLNAQLSEKGNSLPLFSNAYNQSDESWSWEVPEASKTTNERNDVANLRKTISQLENEKSELITNLELLDSEHQLNTEKLMNLKDELQKDYNELEDKYNNLKASNKTLIENVKKYKSELDDLKVKHEALSGTGKGEPVCIKCEQFLEKNQKHTAQIEKLNNEISVLKSNNDTLSKVLEETKKINSSEYSAVLEQLKLCESENKILVSELQRATHSLEAYEKRSELDSENCKKLAVILEGYEQQVSALKEELLAKNVTSSCAEHVEQLKCELREVQDCLQKVLIEKEQTHSKYVNILTDNMKKYVDCDKYSSEVEKSIAEVDPQISEFNHQVESIVNILLDLKSKCESLEKDLYNATEEKTKILSEKNHEIERLIQNSEILSQEVITKSRTIKDYENECNELIKNNDMLISELESLKSTSGLQTISETNEDNLLMLESQLENANKKIEELEGIIAQLEHRNSTEYTMDEISNNYISKAIYHELLESFEELNRVNIDLKEQLENSKATELSINDEKYKLSTTLEKMKVDLENTEYQYTEINVNMEILKEEVENQKKKIGELSKEKVSLEKQIMECDKNNEDIRSEFYLTREKLLLEEDRNKQLEAQIRNLTEKLQNAKMCETSLKLQYDTINKELMSVTEAKMAAETSLKSTLSNLDQCRDDLLQLQVEHEKLKNSFIDVEKDKSVEGKDREVINIDDPNSCTNQSEELEEGKDDNEERDIQVRVEKHVTKNGEVNDLQMELQKMEKLHEVIVEEKNNLEAQLENLISIQREHQQCSLTISTLEKKIEELNMARNELTDVIITKHQESITYHNEIQRLSQILNAEIEKNHNMNVQLQSLKASTIDDNELRKKEEEIEKLTDQNNFLREKCDVLTQNLLDEQSRNQQILAEHSGPSEKELVLIKKLERLQTHLIEVEEHYTQELLRAEEKNNELQTKVNEVEQREKNSSTMYTSVSIRANQHVETLQHQLQLITNQRDELRKKISDAEDHASKQDAALANLQFVLEQFQKEKENDVINETERIRRQIKVEKQVQEDLRREIASLQSQLEESKHGLQAASRLTDQLEQLKRQNATLKTEVSQLKEKHQKSEERLHNLSTQSDGKVDKSLIKNLVIGFVSSNNNLNKDQTQILNIIATVLDFNQQDHDKVKLSKPQQGWLSSFLSPQSSQGLSQESLSQAFVKFLENESKPRNVPSLLSSNRETPKSRKNSVTTVPRHSPSILSEVVLPTFADFAQNRNSSSILKDVLKDNSIHNM